ncbi:MAG: hypothetical protein A2Z72_03665 [Omnitrophica bacterium RBG_13_46_9]|nr:MAG: hypothetical protein A2Z72_03665 [Omnitrophica bacterium RBG_13_46_9]
MYLVDIKGEAKTYNMWNGVSGTFTHEPESHACKGADEWLSVQGSAPPIERNPVKREATAVRRWSFTVLNSR